MTKSVSWGPTHTHDLLQRTALYSDQLEGMVGQSRWACQAEGSRPVQDVDVKQTSPRKIHRRCSRYSEGSPATISNRAAGLGAYTALVANQLLSGEVVMM